MSRITDILTKARDILGDTDAERWTDHQLLRILDEGQKEAVLYAQLLRTKVTTPVLLGVSEYSKPSDCFLITRILVDGTAIDFSSHEEMDILQDRGRIEVSDTGWEDVTGDTTCKIVYDKLNYDKFKLYPIPEASSENSFDLEAATQVPEDTLYDTIYGIMTGATGYTTNTNYGFTVDMSDDYDNTFVDSTTGEASVYGLCTIFEDNAKGITIYYLKRPDDITATTDTLEIDESWDTALKHYVAGTALKYNKDTQDRQMADEELAMFGAAVASMKDNSSRNFMRINTIYKANYKTGFQGS